MKISFYYDGEWFASKEVIDSYAKSTLETNHYLTESHSWDIFGELLMKALHFSEDVSFMNFYKVKDTENLYNVFYCDSQEDYVLTVSLDTIIKGLKNVELRGETEITTIRKENKNDNNKV